MALSTEQFRHIFVVDRPLIKPPVFDRLIKTSEETGQPLEQLLVEQAFITSDQYLELLSEFFEVPSTQLQLHEIDTETLSVVPEQFANENLVMPFATEDGQFCVATIDPSNQAVIEQVQQMAGGNIKLFVTTEGTLRRALVIYDGDLKSRINHAIEEIANQTQQNGGHISHETMAPLLDRVIETAVLMTASDVHVEQHQTELVIRFRIDGVLETIASIPKEYGESFVAQIKVVADLKIDEQRLPQDGRFAVSVKGSLVNVRVACLPAMWGHKIVMRILPKESQLFNMANLGMLEHDIELIRHHLAQPHGMILVTGPTNSGKSTSLYACLQEIALERSDKINISTIEDPIEYSMPGVTQVQTNDDLTFSLGLRSLLRQDPDVLMVGEIRDNETADFAIRAALVGRLLLSTLHTNDSTSTPARLLDMGIPPYLVSSTLSLVVAQRLARRLCEHCRQPFAPDEHLIEELMPYGFERSLQLLNHLGIVKDPEAPLQFYKAVGCEQCDNSGYRGRIGLYEFLECTKPIKDSIAAHDDSDKIRTVALEQGMKTIFDDGLAKVLMGHIDVDELLFASYA